jgi:hypothetical protein
MKKLSVLQDKVAKRRQKAEQEREAKEAERQAGLWELVRKDKAYILSKVFKNFDSRVEEALHKKAPILVLTVCNFQGEL